MSTKTYTLGLLQAKSFRFLKQKGNSLLSQYNLNTTEWAILGLIYENKKSTKTELSNILLFKKPFLTKIISELKKKKFLIETRDKTDKRSEILTLTNYGEKFVEKTEEEISFFYNIFLSFFDAKELEAYINFISKISKMSDSMKETRDKSDEVYKD